MLQKLFFYPAGVAKEIGMTQVQWHEFNQCARGSVVSPIYIYAQCPNGGWWHCFDNRKNKGVYHSASTLNELISYEVKSGRNKRKR